MNLTNIGIFGRTNTGKSSLINTLIGQEFAIVSDTPGTTTDPIKKRLEIFGLGPCQLIDTAGLDDNSELGKKRVAKTKEVIAQIDLALLLFTANNFDNVEKKLLKELKEMNVPVILVHNQSDIIPLNPETASELSEIYAFDLIEFSCSLIDEDEQREVVELLLSLIVKGAAESPYRERPLFENMIEKDDEVVLVCPIDSQAPTGRLILPQVMAVRDLLDRQAIATVLLPEQLPIYIETKVNSSPLSIPPKLVVTDSQVFSQVAKIVPAEIPLTSFSMLLARSKGCFYDYIEGTPTISQLKDGDRILILESCSHHASCEDIGRVKLPNLFKKFTGKKLEFEIVAGLDKIPREITEYALVAQCGGCVITARQLASRLQPALKKKVPVTNYGMAIAYMSGIFERAVEPFNL